MLSIIDRLKRSVAIHGFWGTLSVGARFCLDKISQLTGPRHHGRAADLDAELEFDRRWGVDTSGRLLPGPSEVVGSNWVYGQKYQGVDPTILGQILQDLSLRYEDFTFIDFGSGKGRAVMVASRFPFTKVIGVEYSEGLHNIAQRNLARFPENEKKCKEIELVWSDAATYQIPDGPLVVFLYNPFGKEIMTRLVKRVAKSLQADPRRMLVLYFLGRSACPELWSKTGLFNEVRRSKAVAIYDTQAGAT